MITRKELEEAFPSFDTFQVVVIEALLNKTTTVEDFDSYLSHRSGSIIPFSSVLECLNTLGDFHGIESLWIKDDETENLSQLLLYCNAGDSYAATFILFQDEITIGCWADHAEEGRIDYEYNPY